MTIEKASSFLNGVASPSRSEMKELAANSANGEPAASPASTSPETTAKGIAASGFCGAPAGACPESAEGCRFWMPDFGTKKRNRHGGRRSGWKAGAYAPSASRTRIDAKRFP
jgi:hypothetical protein